MNEFLITITSGVLVAIIVSWFGIGGTKHISVHGAPMMKTGKIIIMLAVVMVFGGAYLVGHNSTDGFDLHKPEMAYGFTLVILGLFVFVIGKIVAWFQQP